MRPVLAERGIVLPALTRGERAHYRFAKELRPKDQKAGAPASKELLSAIQQLDAVKTPLLTCETFMASDPWALNDRFGQISARRPKFLFYMRPHASLLASHYLQLVKTGIHSEPVAGIFPQLMRLPPMRFINIVEAYADEFGDESMTVREFSRKRLISGSIVADFWNAFDLPQDLLETALASETVANPTPTLESSVLLRAWRLHLVQQLKVDDHPGMALQPVSTFFRALTDCDLPGQKFRLPVAVQEELAETWEGPRKNFAMRWFQLPPTGDWLKEGIVAPSSPQALPFDAVEAATISAAKRMSRLEMTHQSAVMSGFLSSLPVEAEGGARMIDIAALDQRISALPRAAHRFLPRPAARAVSAHLRPEPTR